MATNPYFRLYPSITTSEQNLVEDLVIEAMKIHGMDLYYLPRSSQDSVDLLFGEDQLKKFTDAYVVEMYLENVLGMEGEGDFISKFGLEIHDEMTLLVSRKRFLNEVPLTRPREGDLLYIPLIKNFLEISFVEHENNQAMFYTLGKGRGGNVYVYALKLKQFVFSNEIIETGIAEIDEQIRDEYQKVRLNIEDANGAFSNDEIVFQGSSYINRTGDALVYNTTNTYIDIYRTRGQFILTANTSSFANTILKSNTSNSTANVISIQDMTVIDNTFEDVIDNSRVDSESNAIEDWLEKNPFGES